MNRNLVNSKLDKYRERGKGTYTFCQVGCDCNIAVNLLEKCENLQSKIDKANFLLKDMLNRAYFDGKYINYDYGTAEILEVYKALNDGELDILKEDK